MTICISCGKSAKTWNRICRQCYKIRRRASANIPQPIVAKNFMEDMGINRW